MFLFYVHEISTNGHDENFLYHCGLKFYSEISNSFINKSDKNLVA